MTAGAERPVGHACRCRSGRDAGRARQRQRKNKIKIGGARPRHPWDGDKCAPPRPAHRKWANPEIRTDGVEGDWRTTPPNPNASRCAAQNELTTRERGSGAHPSHACPARARREPRGKARQPARARGMCTAYGLRQPRNTTTRSGAPRVISLCTTGAGGP